MSTTEVQKRIDELEAEGATLKTKHEETVKQFQQIVQQNQQRYAFIQGSIAELQKLKDNGTNGDGQITIAPVARRRGRPRANRIPTVVE